MSSTAQNSSSMISPGPQRRGFTLIELMVSIAAIGVLSLGLAQIFAVAGKTVSAGRRVSTLTQYASALQRQLAEDVSRMTRDGFLVIRNELLPGPVQTAPGSSRKDRRVDMLQFFATGQFESVRQAVIPGKTARAPEARIFWGHGLRRESTSIITLSDDNRSASYFGAPGPNQYAGSWVLARHVTLLAQPSSVFDDASAYGAPGYPPRDLVDSDIQIAGEPAARDIFLVPTPAGASESTVTAANSGRNASNPNLGSGVVDIATTDLASIRRTLLFLPPAYGSIAAFYSNNPGEFVEGPEKREDMQTWMRLSWPGDPDLSRRLRVEPVPPNVLGIDWTRPDDPISRADQLALAASSFVPNCSEFIVEWSFGELDSRGRLLWHGLTRDVDLNSDGTVSTNAGEYRVTPYDDQQTPKLYDRLKTRSGGLVPQAFSPRVVRSDLIHGTQGTLPTNITYSYFGLIDPDPASAGYNLGASPFLDADGDGIYDPKKGDVLDWPDTVPWPWPKMIRITVTLADPSDATSEQRFQFVLPVPQGSGHGG